MHGPMHASESWLLSYFVNSLWQIPLLFLAGYLAARIARPIGPRAEHRVWVITLMLQALLPACATLSWNWLSRFIAAFAALPAHGGSVTVITGPGITVSPSHLPQWLPTAIIIAYVASSAWFTTRFLWRWSKLRTLRTEAVEISLSEPGASFWTHCAQQFGIDRVTLAASTRIASPITLGFRHKLILLPVDMALDVSEADLRAVIAHEFAHIRRNDFLKNLFYEVAALPVNYHPFLWLTRERVIESREIVCDHIAAESSGRTQYTHSLLRLASLLVAGLPARTPNAIGIFDASAFERRLMRLKEHKRELHGVRQLAIITACAALGIATCASAMALRLRVDANAPATAQPAANPSKPIDVSPQIMAGNRISGPQIKYPVEAKKKKIQGTVVLHALIGKDGKIKQLKAVSGPKVLEKSSLEAVRGWTYKPYLLNGNPVEVETIINVVYTLGSGDLDGLKRP